MARWAWQATVLLTLTAVALGDDRRARDTYLDAYSASRDSGIPQVPLPAGVVFPTSIYERIAEESTSFEGSGTDHQASQSPAKGYSSPAPSYSAPSQAYGAPQPSYGAPSQNYGTTQPSYGAPSHSYGSPSQNYGASQASYGSPSQNYGSPSQNYGAPSQNYGVPSQNYGASQASYGSPSQNYGSPSQNYGAPSQNYGAPSQNYGAPQHGYGPPSHSYGAPQQPYHYGDPFPFPYDEHAHHPHEKPLKDNHAMAENTPDRGLHSISTHLVLKVILKAVIFKLIVKFIAVICILLFMPTFDHHKEDAANKNEERGASSLPSSNSHHSNEKLDSLTTLVLEGIGKDFKYDDCKETSNCRLARIAQSVDNHYTIKRLLHIFYENAAGPVVIKTPSVDSTTNN